MTIRTFAWVAAALLAGLASCGGGGGSDAVDAGSHGDAGVTPDASDPCTYHEADDAANDVSPEQTGLSVSATGIVLCGQIDARVPDGSQLVDDDIYDLTVPTAGSYLVRIASSDAGDLDLVQAYFATDSHAGLYVGTHGVFVAQLDAGEQDLEIDAFDATQPGAAVPYRLSIMPDDVDARCAALTVTPNYVEANDGTDHTGNDVVTVRDATSLAIGQTATVDAPEPTGLVIAPAMSYALAGATQSSNNAYDDDYADRDTYLIATGANTNELTVRVDWPDADGTDDDADLDAFLFTVPPDGTTAPDAISASLEASVAGPELTTTAVLPSTNYWLWVGSFAGGTSTSDKAYTITVCGATFTP